MRSVLFGGAIFGILTSGGGLKAILRELTSIIN